MSILSEMIEEKFSKIQDAQIREAFFLLKEYAELQAGTWDKIITMKALRRQNNKAFESEQVVMPDEN